MLMVSNIDVFHGKTQALWDVSFRVEEKEIVVMLGANGAGKSTTLITLAGLKQPCSGAIEFLGQNIERMPAHRIVELGMSLVPEGGAYFPKMTIVENLQLGAYCRQGGKAKKESMDRAYEVFPVLKNRAQKLASTLSGGERQMLAIARGLMAKPKVLMLDEPSYGLAPIMVAETFKVIKRLRQQGTTILVVEQSSKHALEIGDRGYLLENGRIILGEKCERLKQNEHVKKAYLGV